MPRVSVVIPSFNRVDLLPRALASVAGQTFKDFEVVVVNDGGSWCAEFDVGQLSQKCSVVHRVNGGPAAARNTGISVTDSEFVAYLDDDDEWHPNHLESLLLTSISQKADLVYGFADVRDCGKQIRVWGDCSFNKFILDSFHTVFPLSACIHRRSPLESTGGFDESPLLIGPEDCEFFIRFSDRCKVAAARACTVTMHRERSMTREPREKWVDTLNYVMTKLGYLNLRRNWLMLYRASVAALKEDRKDELDSWANLLDELLPSGVCRAGLDLHGAIELSPKDLKHFCRSMLESS